MITTEIQKRIVRTIKERRRNYPSNAKMAKFLGINQAQLSRIFKGDYESVLSESNWYHIARILGVQLGTGTQIITALTVTYKFVTKQLAECQDKQISLLLCDIAGIGKTYAAKCYVRENKNSVYIDCSQVKSKQKLVRHIAKEFGLENTGKYADVYEDLVYYIRTLQNPIIVLDEAGDLDYSAWLELKALWNACEGCCGWYMMGADGLRAKIESNLNRHKVGYSELFRRYGERFQKISPDGKEARDDFNRQQVAQVAKANGIENPQELFNKTGGSLTRVSIEIKKSKIAA
jgi:DNA transposition AAA+ family ATPase